MRNYEDKEGVKRTAVDIVAQDVEFLTQRARDDDGQYDELTYDGDKKCCYVDAYKKWENFCVNGAGERQ